MRNSGVGRTAVFILAALGASLAAATPAGEAAKPAAVTPEARKLIWGRDLDQTATYWTGWRQVNTPKSN